MHSPHTAASGRTWFRIDNLSFTRGQEFCLQQFSLEMDNGEILCLLGPSGSGKTSLLRLIAGLEPPETGSIHLAGRELQRVVPHKRNIGMMFQEYALFPHLSVAENVGFGLSMHGMGKDEADSRVHDMLELVDLHGYGQRRIDELSGGERQRVALARSLAPQPRLLLLDEPFGSLDRQLRERLAEDTGDILKRFGMTTIFVTHDQQEAFSVADRIGILHRGKLLQCAPPEEVYRQPANITVAGFLGLGNIVHPNALDGSPNPLYQRLSGWLALKEGANLPLLVHPHGWSIVDCSNNTRNSEHNCLTGTILKRVFTGGHYRISCSVDGCRLDFTLPMEPAPPLPGGQVCLHSRSCPISSIPLHD